MKDYRVSHLPKEKVSQYENKIYSSGLYDDYLWEDEKKYLTREIELLKNIIPQIRYLDFATGTGRIIQFLEDKVEGSVGVDISENMVKVARDKTKHSEFVVGDITKDSSLLVGKFDFITAFRFFLNAQPELRGSALLFLVSRLCDENSRFMFNVHGNLFSHRSITKLWYMARGRQLNTLTRSEVYKMTEQHGLEIIRWYGIGILPKILYRVFNVRLILLCDRIISKIPFMRYMAYDLIFVCQKKVF